MKSGTYIEWQDYPYWRPGIDRNIHQRKVGSQLMRVGMYATVGGTEFSVRADYYAIIVFVTEPPPGSAGWEPTSMDRWAKRISRDEVTRLFEVHTDANFESLPVSVDYVDHKTGKAGIIAAPGAGGAGQQIAHPPHGDLSPMHGNAASLDGWYGNVDIDRLADIREYVEELDLFKFGNPRTS